jgi:cell division protein FtsX
MDINGLIILLTCLASFLAGAVSTHLLLTKKSKGTKADEINITVKVDTSEAEKQIKAVQQALEGLTKVKIDLPDIIKRDKLPTRADSEL